MKLEQKNHSHEEIIGVQESNALRISEDSQAMIIDSLINLYSDPVGSVVRELTSNCIDAHRERDLKLKGMMPLSADDDVNWLSDKLTVSVSLTDANALLGIDANISFNDSGVGLSPQRVKDIYTVLGVSTKRDDNHQIGGFGLGCKSPWAYTDNFYVNTRHNGTEYFYLMHKGETVPSMDLVHTRETTEKNGTSVIVPLTDRTNHSVNKFVKAINNQLAYFKHVVYEGFESYDSIKKYDPVEETDKYIITHNSSSYEYKVLIGNVLYPLETEQIEDIDNLNITPDLIPRVDIGVVDLVPSREAIRYTPKTKRVLGEIFNSIAETFKKDVETSFNALTDLYEAYNYWRQLQRYYYGSPRISTMDIIPFKAAITGQKENLKVDLSKWELDIDGVTLSNLLSAYKVYLFQRDYGRSGSKGKASARPANSDDIMGADVLYKVADKFNFRTNEAIVQNSASRSKYAFKYRTRANSSDSEWRSISYGFKFDENIAEDNGMVLEDVRYGKVELTLQKVQEKLEKYMKFPNLKIYEDVDTSSVTDEIAEQEETPEQRRKRLGKVFFRYVKTQSFDRAELDVIDVTERDTRKYIYGFKDDIQLLRDVYQAVRQTDFHKTFKVITISKNVEKHMFRHINVHDFIKYDERWTAILEEFLNDAYIAHEYKAYYQSNILDRLNKTINKKVAVGEPHYGYKDYDCTIDRTYEEYVEKFYPDFEPKKELVQDAALTHAWFSKMSILRSNIFKGAYVNLDSIGLQFMMEHMERVNAETTLEKKELCFKDALTLYLNEGTDWERNQYINAVIHYPHYQPLKDQINDLEERTTENIVNLILEYKEHFTSNYESVLVEFCLKYHEIFVTLNEALASQLTLELETI